MNPEITYQLCAFFLTVGILFIGRTSYALTRKYDHEEQLTHADNPAVGWVTFGFLAGLLIVLASVLMQDTEHDGRLDVMIYDLIELGVYSLAALALLNVSGLINDRYMLGQFDNKKELVDDRNQGVGVAILGSYIASALMIAGTISGPGGSLEPSEFWSNLASDLGLMLVYFVGGQLLLILFVRIYITASGVDVLAELAKDYEQDGRQFGGNAAAGVALGLNVIAFGVLLLAGGRSTGETTMELAQDYALYALVGLILLPVWRRFTDKIMLHQADLHKEIYEDRNVNAALIEGISVNAVAISLFLIL